MGTQRTAVFFCSSAIGFTSELRLLLLEQKLFNVPSSFDCDVALKLLIQFPHRLYSAESSFSFSVKGQTRRPVQP